MYLCARVVVSVCLFRVFGLPVFVFDIDVCVRDVCVCARVGANVRVGACVLCTHVRQILPLASRKIQTFLLPRFENMSLLRG